MPVRELCKSAPSRVSLETGGAKWFCSYSLQVQSVKERVTGKSQFRHPGFKLGPGWHRLERPVAREIRGGDSPEEILRARVRPRIESGFM